MILLQRLLMIFNQCSFKSKYSKINHHHRHINHLEDPIARSIEQYKNHPSIVAIQSKRTNKYSKFNKVLFNTLMPGSNKKVTHT